MRLYLLLLSVLLISVGYAQPTERYHRARITFDSIPQIQRLIERGVAVDHGKRGRNSIESDFSEWELSVVRSAGLQYRILRPDINRYYVDQNDPNSPHYVAPPFAHQKALDCGPSDSGPGGEISTPTNYHGGSMGGFLTYAEMLRELDEMYAYSEANGLHILSPRAENIDPTDPENFRTQEGNYQQWVLIGAGAGDSLRTAAEVELFYNALHHAREPASMQQLIYYMWYLLENYATDPGIRALVDRTDMYFMPCVNPDGYLFNEQQAPSGGGMWRKNRRDGHGVDNNRNYDYITPDGESVFAGRGTDDYPHGQTYPGTEPFSEPENRGVRHFIETHDFKLILNNHSHGHLLLFPFGYDYGKQSADHELFEAISAEMVAGNGYNNMLGSELYPAAGNSDDFGYGYLHTVAGGERNRSLAMTPEIGYSFWPAAAHIEPICRTMVRHNLRAAQLSGSHYALGGESITLSGLAENRLEYRITRLGLVADEPAVSIVPISGNIVRIGATAPLDTLEVGRYREQTLHFDLSPDIQPGETIEFELVLQYGKQEERRYVREVYGDPAIAWTDGGDSLGRWETEQWGVDHQRFHPASPSTSLSDSPRRPTIHGYNSLYLSNQDTYIELREPIDLTGRQLTHAEIQFSASYALESHYDFVQLHYQLEGSDQWSELCGRFTRDVIDIYTGRVHRSVYTGTQKEWVEERVDLSPLLGERIRVRFWFHSDEDVTNEGFFFDRFGVNLYEDAPVSSTNVPVRTVLPEFYPNPFARQLYLRMDAERYDLFLRNSVGQVVHTATGLSYDAEVQLGELPPGVYFATISTPTGRHTSRLIRR